MHEILRHLPAGVRVLDLGSGTGTFNAAAYPIQTIRVDLQPPAGGAPAGFVQADAASLPFPDSTFSAVISNNSLEHFDQPDAAIREMARVVHRDGSVYVAVPDSSTFTDRLYRWLARGGGHVNAFSSREELVRLLERATGMRLAASRPLASSLSFLNRRNRVTPHPRKLLLLGGGREGTLVVWSAIARFLDRWLRTRISVYGWAFYFGTLEEHVDSIIWSNVCIRCGAGCASDWLEAAGVVRRRWLAIPGYRCPSCGAWNVFTRDSAFKHVV